MTSVYLHLHILFLQFLHEMCEIRHGALLRDVDVALSGVRLTINEQVARTIALVFMILPGRTMQRALLRLAHIPEKLLRALVHAHDRSPGIVRRLIQVQHIFHFRYEFPIYFRNTPFLLLPQLEVALFKT